VAHRLRNHSPQKTKRISAVQKRLRLFVLLPLLLMIIWGTVKSVHNYIVESDKEVAVAELEKQLQKELDANAELKQEMANLQDPEYREQKARQQLQMGKPGEIHFSLPD
jgi:cell division protein DivIC